MNRWNILTNRNSGVEELNEMKNALKTTIQSSNFTPEYLTEEHKNTSLKMYMQHYVHHSIIYNSQDIKTEGGPSRWQRSKTWRSPSSPQTHQKYIYLWNNSYRTPTERWQKTSDLPKGKKLPTYLGRAKEKRKNRDKRIGTGPAPVGGSCEGGKVSTH